MPEGDTLLRTARTLDRWLAGREITAARSRVEGVAAEKLVGRRIESVEANGKHCLMRLDSGHVLHTHMKMTGSWHVYPTGHPWRRPDAQARLVLTCGDRVAVCFNVPVIELLRPRAVALHPALAGLGPDVLVTPLDLDEVRRRTRARPQSTPVGELLLDQRVVAGIGNIWRCEALSAEGHNPWTPVSALTDDELDALVVTASVLMEASVASRTGVPEAGPAGGRRVYRRSGQPCRRCGTAVQSRRQGEQARTAYWCPTCQPLRAATEPSAATPASPGAPPAT
jgi:endonuclease VIII